MHQRCPTGLVPFIDVAACGKCSLNRVQAILFVTHGMPLMDSIDYRRHLRPCEQHRQKK
jgi:hypothetical protein